MTYNFMVKDNEVVIKFCSKHKLEIPVQQHIQDFV